MSLVLARKQGQSILIGRDVKVKVHSVKGKVVGLLIDAPASVRVDREEVRERREPPKEVA